MCFDPVSLSLAALGGGASIIGGQQNAQAQADYAGRVAGDNTAAATASNKVLSKFEDTQALNQNKNNDILATTYAATDPTTFQGDQSALGTAATNNATSAIAATLAGAKQPALTNTDNGQSAAEIASRTGTMTGKSIRDATNAAKLGAFGNNFAQLGLKEADSARGIDTVNQTARSQASALPSQESTAALLARHFIAPANLAPGTALQGIGNVFASLGGSGMGKKAGDFLSGPSISNPSLTPFTSGGVNGASPF